MPAYHLEANLSVSAEAGMQARMSSQGLGQSSAHERALLEQAMWLVYVEGGPTVGPVSAHQVAQGIRSGHVPADASIQRAGEVFWTGVLENPAVIAALKSV